MLLPLRSLVDRKRYPATRVAELERLRARFSAQPTRRAAGSEAAAHADSLRDDKLAIASAFGEVDACAGCAAGHPLPAGRWSGGHCCSGRTLDVFTVDEVAALKVAGTRPGDLVPPRDDHAGCAFRGAGGCSLSVEHRPSICLRYVCLELRAELRDGPRWVNIADHGSALARGLTAFRRALGR